MSISERITPQKMNYVLFWFLVSVFVYGIWEGLSFLLRETDFRLMRVTLSFLDETDFSIHSKKFKFNCRISNE
jgi:hypothetical protein